MYYTARRQERIKLEEVEHQCNVCQSFGLRSLSLYVHKLQSASRSMKQEMSKE